MTASDAAFEYLARAESTLLDYSSAQLVNDEAELLRGCLSALVTIARLQYEAHGPEAA
ncbi:MAG: hypothetical protein ACJ786_36205 [Catenulispora sp.]